MNDLISRKALMKEFGIDEDTHDLAKILIAVKLRDIEKIINRQPTAYDVGKVVKQLEEVRDELLHSTDYNNDIINYCLDWFDMAIEIVKGAVKDE